MAELKPFFHAHDGICFRRLDDGAVQIFTKALDDSETEFGEFDKNSWASIIAYVSAGDEIDGRYYAALAWHDSTGPVEIRPKASGDGESYAV